MSIVVVKQGGAGGSRAAINSNADVTRDERNISHVSTALQGFNRGSDSTWPVVVMLLLLFVPASLFVPFLGLDMPRLLLLSALFYHPLLQVHQDVLRLGSVFRA